MHALDQCANCERAVVGPEQKFCPACGQPTPVHRIDWHFLGHELEHSVLHMDRGILYSLKELMLRPGHLIRDYIEGRRVRQVKPLMLLMIMAAIVVFLSKYMLEGDVLGSAFMVSDAGPAREGADAQFETLLVETFTAVKQWINTHYAAFTLLLLPLEAAAFQLAFRSRGLNYPEWLVVTAFLTAQAFVFLAAAILLQRWFPQAQAWGMGLAAVYALFSLIQLFQAYPRWKSTLRGVLGFGIFWLMQTVLTLAVVAVVFVLSTRS